MSPPRLPKEILQEAADALLANKGNQSHAADALGLSRGAFQNRIAIARREGIDFAAIDEMRRPKLVMKGQSILYDAEGNEKGRWDKTKQEGRDPEAVEHLPDPKKIVKVSTLYDQQGKVTQQWIAEKPEDAEREALWTTFAAELANTIERAKPTKAPKHTSDELLSVYPVGDHHNGMMSWAKETGVDYDLEIAERLLCDAFDRLIAAAPQSDTALIPFLGDFFHIDSYDNVTPSNRHLLDADSRYPKIIAAGVRQIRYAVDAALKKHQHVIIIFEPGNHDPSTAAAITIFLAALYEKEPRVTVDTSPAHFHYFEWGAVLLGTNHGDKVKADKLPGIMAHDRPEAWGRTKHRRWLTGHIHHETLKELPGCIVESFGVLAAPDAYSANNGYRSVQQMQALVFHREDGLIERHTVTPAMLERRKAA